MRAVLYLGFCADFKWLSRFSSSGKLVPFSSSRPPLSAVSSPHAKNEKVKPFCLPHAFLFDLSEFLNPMVEKESIQWMRLSESENPFYLFLINKITHPLKFIKKVTLLL